MTEVWAMTSDDVHGVLQQQPERILNFASRVLGEFEGKTIATKTSPRNKNPPYGRDKGQRLVAVSSVLLSSGRKS